jgi:hypothetical protein
MHEFDFVGGVVTLARCGIDLPATADLLAPFANPSLIRDRDVLFAAVVVTTVGF